jgi:hypothetical protein
VGARATVSDRVGSKNLPYIPLFSRLASHRSSSMTILWYRVRIALANLFLDLAEAVAPEEVRRERDRLRARR